jgi:hypothetical protein
MDRLEELPDGWEVWNAEPGGRVVLAFRPDVFDGSDYPPACLPTVTVGPGASPDGRPDPQARSGEWHVALYLEPDVRLRSLDAAFTDRDAAVEQAVAVAREFVAGAVDVRGAYAEPREAYLDQLTTLLDDTD